MWECGLKPLECTNIEYDSKSLLMWECGLKHTEGDYDSGLCGHSLCGSVD